MRKHSISILGRTFATILLLGACEGASGVIGPQPAHSGAGARASGGVSFIGDPFFTVPVHLAFVAIQRDSITGDADGGYVLSGSVDGLKVHVQGRVTCLTVDPANPGRAWMGGVITKNASEHPRYTGATSQVGRESWFRVVDYGEGVGASQPDRASMVFVEPIGGFTTGQAFCDARLWFPEDRLTNPLLGGNLQVRQ